MYHVQTLLEDVNKDLLEPQLGTRNITIYENGCYGRTDPNELHGFCSVFAPAQMKEALQIPSFLYSAAVVQMLGGNDNYPSYPFNYNFVEETATNRIWYMPDDLDDTIDSSVVHADPFSTMLTEGDSQRHFTALMEDGEYRALYRSYLREVLALLQPAQLKPLVAAKYAQVRETLLASPDLPLGKAWYDYVYQTEIPNWIEERYAFLTALLEGTANRPPQAVIAPLPTMLEAPDAAGVAVQLNSTASSDPDNDPLTFHWAVDGQEVGQTSVATTTLGLGAHVITLTVQDGRGGTGTATAAVQVVLAASNHAPVAIIAPLLSSVPAADASGATVTVNGAASNDPDNDPLTYSWAVDGQGAGQAAVMNLLLSVGTHTIVLTVQDGRGGVGTASAAIQVTPPIGNRPPTAVIAPLPPTVSAPNPAGIIIELDGTRSSDPDGDPLTYIWQVDGQEVGRGDRIGVLVGIGARSIALTVEDGHGGVSTATTSLQILPPALSITSVSPISLSRGSNTIIVITGTGFAPNATVVISGVGVIPDTYYSRSNTSISVYSYVFSFATLGPRDVTVINPDGTSAVLRGAIFVQ
ncbi:MAG: PKD domain-containing protein [Blastocatellia bacterium]